MAHVPDDARLPKAFEGLVLVCEALSSIGLRVQAENDQGRDVAGDGTEAGLVDEMKNPEDGEGLIKPIIGMELRARPSADPQSR
jgi:ataxin-10